MIFLAVNSWAFTLTTVLDFRDTFATVRQYSFPSVVATSTLNHHIHVALLAVYDYIATGDTSRKAIYLAEFNEAIRQEYELFQISQTTSDIEFTQLFNDKLLAMYNTADELVKLYEADPADPRVEEKLNELNVLNDNFNVFLETEITDQVTKQVEQSNASIIETVRTIQLYMVGVGIVALLIIIFSMIFINTNITKPVRLLTEAARSFGKGHFRKVTIRRNDELGLFAQTFNTMAENIQASQTALQEELAKTKELDRQKSEFLSIAAHQLRTPMAGIKWASQMLYDGDMGGLNGEQKHHIGNALENIDRMIHLINDLLDVTKIEEQKFKYNFVVSNIVTLINEQIALLKTGAKENAITVAVTTTPDQPIYAEIDQEKFALAVNNLLDNAIKYSKRGGRVDVHLDALPDKIVGYVRDYGLGIPAKSHDEVFTKFFRGPNILKVVTEGSGLGLFLVRDILTKHEGKVWFESEENKGTTFYFELPYHQPKATATATVQPLVVES